jgi:protein PhnA
MILSNILKTRCNNLCELCSETDNNLHVYTIPPKTEDIEDNQTVLCSNCYNRIVSLNYEDANYWRFLTGSIWSEVKAVQTLTYKILSKLNAEDWASESIESVALDEDVINWANAEDELEASKLIHKDAYGVQLANGDTIILTQNLNIKGASFTASKGTVVRKIKLVADNDEQIEGKIEGDTIVILTKFVRKSTV